MCFAVQFRQSTLRAEEKEGKRAGAGVCTDDRADKIDRDIGDAEALAHLRGKKFRVGKTVAVADENGLLLRFDGTGLHTVDQRKNGVLSAACLGDVDEMTLIVDVQNGLDAQVVGAAGQAEAD